MTGAGCGRAGRVVLLALGVGCAHHAPPTDEPAVPLAVGLYRLELARPDGPTLRVRCWLHAELPDRLHAEILTPLGATVLIVDGGGGRLSVAFVRDREAYGGVAERHTLASLLGLDVALDELVGALLEGRKVEGLELQRRGPGGTLPEALRLESSAGSLELRLRRRSARGAGVLGTGATPPGYRVLPLSALPERDWRADLHQAS